MIFSFSRLSLFEKCPFRFHCKYVLKMEEGTTKPLALGKAVHKAIESMISGSDLEEAILDGWIEAEMHSGVTHDEISQLVKKAPIYAGIGEVETHFTLPLSGDPDAPLIQGYIDLIQGNNIIDWKTNWKPYAIEATKQLALYAWAFMKLKGGSSVHGNLYYLRFPYITERRMYNRVINQIEADQARQWALKLAIEVEERIALSEAFPEERLSFFPSIPSTECKHCPFAVECYKQTRRV
ncbi:PD-(D/E)XK nuclease family protein [Paenibacillus agricola]|uniref:PD-(D/E)XK nuclease family protein n=1 Tax=Paenibacillus agricola TaxID=2716264 RepID=A0ABX0JG18_9BACL|nr:PD-(D/E)XK nuclease family protein [Paenibacillus agricola]NHN35512.1 PD-(D/E)XK nuclease family protein [Paenibacillus agricola]